ncbi:hypothetical protein [Paludisphaera soli]|uniref:hypothetical protein n=1 Tax=Paludisphaera soli TaxID=2712865 RepID=UPI0013EAFA9C|nr:hypothetical protein [Paludisphaera soli]
MALDLGLTLAEVEGMPARERARWRVYFRHRPRFDPWWAMSRLGVALFEAFGAKATIEQFYPKVEVVKRRRRRSLKPEDAARAFESMFGVGG